MYAVIKSGARQYKVTTGETVVVERVKGNPGDKITFDHVLAIGGTNPVFGSPTIKGAKVEATIKDFTFNPKVVIFKYKRRKNYKRTRGHKQPVMTVEIGKIVTA